MKCQHYCQHLDIAHLRGLSPRAKLKRSPVCFLDSTLRNIARSALLVHWVRALRLGGLLWCRLPRWCLHALLRHQSQCPGIHWLPGPPSQLPAVWPALLKIKFIMWLYSQTWRMCRRNYEVECHLSVEGQDSTSANLQKTDSGGHLRRRAPLQAFCRGVSHWSYCLHDVVPLLYCCRCRLALDSMPGELTTWDLGAFRITP